MLSQVLRETNAGFSNLDIKLLKLYAVKVAATLGVQQLHWSSEMYRTQCTTLAEVWSGTVEPNESISRLVANTRKVVAGDFTFYYQVDTSGGGAAALKLVESDPLPPPGEPALRVPVEGSFLGSVVSSGKSVMGAPIDIETFNREFDAPADTELAGVLAVPVKQPDQTVVGVLYTGKIATDKQHGSLAFMEEDLHKVLVMCGLLAQLTSWSHLQADMLKIEDQCTRLSDLVSFLCNTSTKKDNEMQLQEMVKLAKEAVGAEIAMLHIAQGKVAGTHIEAENIQAGSVFKRCEICVVSRQLSHEEDDPVAQRPSILQPEREMVSRFVDNKIHEPPLTPVGDGITGLCITTAEMQSTVLVRQDNNVIDPNSLIDINSDVPHEPGFMLKPMAVLSIPIVSQEDEPLGALTVLNKQQSMGPFTVEDSTLLNILATSLAACIVAGNPFVDPALDTDRSFISRSTRACTKRRW